MSQKYFYSSKTQLTVLQDGISEEKSEESPTINIQGVGLKPCVLEILNWANLSNFILKQNSVTFEKHKKRNSIIHDLLKRKSEYPKKLLTKRKPQQSSLSPNFRVLQNDIQRKLPGNLQINNTMRFPQKHKVMQRSTTLANFNKSRAKSKKLTNRISNSNLNSSCCCQDCGQKSSKFKLLGINKNNLLDKVFDQFVNGSDDGRYKFANTIENLKFILTTKQIKDRVSNSLSMHSVDHKNNQVILAYLLQKIVNKMQKINLKIVTCRGLSQIEIDEVKHQSYKITKFQKQKGSFDQIKFILNGLELSKIEQTSYTTDFKQIQSDTNLNSPIITLTNYQIISTAIIKSVFLIV